MALNVGDIVKLTDVQTYGLQLVENVYFYRITAIPVPFTDMTVDESVAHAFQSVIPVAAIPLQHGGLLHSIVRMDNVTNGIDFVEIPVGSNGSASGDPEPSFMALNFVLRRSNGLTRNGSKRLGGITEDEVNGNAFAGSTSALNNFVAALSAKLKDFTLPTPAEFAEPVIVGRKLVTTTGGKSYYELDLTKINPVATAGFTALSTQRSRKVGHGV